MTNQSKIIITLAILTFFGFAKSSRAATINAASCLQPDVQFAINAAASGDVVNVPDGTCIWSTPVICNKELNLRGAGVGNTVIVNGRSDSLAIFKGIIVVDTTVSLRITGMEFHSDETVNLGARHIDINGDKNFRIDHCKFAFGGNATGTVYSSNNVYIDGLTYGVIDNNIFYASGREILRIQGAGDTAWTEEPEYGSVDAVFIEDNIVTGDHDADGDSNLFVMAWDGARVVVRHNTIDATNGTVDVHGWCGTGTLRAGRIYEIYSNIFIAKSGSWGAMQLRGGTGLIYDNIFTEGGGQLYRKIGLTEYRVNRADTLCAPQGCCTQYPCQDQIGRGKDTGLGTNQASEPVYIWNQNSGADVTIYNTGMECAGALCEDYIQDVPHEGEVLPDYYSNTERPGYIPYTYPHPLRGEEQSDTTAPAAPGELAVN